MTFKDQSVGNRTDELEKELAEKTAELQSKERELQIESSLEKVRAIALSMMQPADMLEICKTISAQLAVLGVKEIRNVQTAIFHEERGVYFNYEYYAKHDKTIFTETDYRNHEVSQEFADRMLKGAGEFFTHSFQNRKELNEWIKYQKTTNVFIDSFLETAPSLIYYWYSLGPVALGMSTYVALSEEEINLFKRFKNVFELSYRRYLDIEKAEAQAHEARIEASLERVRASAMAMHTTDELKSVGEIIYHELESLGFADLRNTEIIINNNEKETILSHYCDYGICGTIEVDYKTNPILQKWANDLKKASDAFVPVVISEKEMPAWRKFREEIGYQPDEKLNAASSVYYYSYSTGLGALSISSFVPISDEQMKILGRFRNVFALAYRRYVDVALAEAQAREAQIELALERVRARSLAMHHSTELHEVAEVLFQQLLSFGGNVLNAGFTLCKPDADEDEYWLSSDSGIRPVISVPHTEDPIQKKLYEGWKNKLEFYSESRGGDELKAHYNYMVSVPALKPYFEEGVSNRQFPTWQKWHAAYFSHGYVFMLTTEEYDEEKILVRFARIFDQAYTRFLDLQKAEAQTRESQIELALERVRARTMAMQKSDELSETAQVLFQQFNDLGAAPIQITIGIFNEEEGVIEFRSTDPLGTGARVDYAVKGNLEEPTLLKKIYNDWKEGKKSTVIALAGKELSEWVKYRISMSGVPDNKDYSDARRVVFVGFFSKGMLSVSAMDDPSRESVQLLERFAGVFDLTYTRFLDLQKAEAQAREAQIQLALERVRARTMAMQKSNELAETSAVLSRQFAVLGESAEQISIGILNEEEEVFEMWISMNDSPENPVYKVSINEPTVLQKLYRAWKAKKKSLVIDLTGDELLKYVRFRETLGGAYINDDLKRGRRVVHSAFFSKGMITLSAEKPRAGETIQLLERFADVFDLTYTRFLDLQKAEAQSREAQIEASLERVRSRAMAMHESNHLTEAASALFTELNKLGINPIRTGFVLLTKESRRAKLYPATSLDKEKTVSYTGEFEFIGHPVYERQYESWQKRENYFPVLEGDVLKSYYRILSEALSVSFDHFLETDKQFGCFLPFSEGFLFTWSVEPYSKEEVNILDRFKSILDLTIRRYIDLQKAEAQTRESQIETGLERVRSRTLAMHSSDELAETAAVVFRQLINLGIEPNRLYIVIIKDENGDAEFWITDEDGSKVSSGFHANLNDNPTFQKMFVGWKEQKKSITIDMQGEELQEYFHHLSELHVPFKGGLAQTRRVQNIAYFSQGFIGIASPDSQPQETDRLLERFASVFNLTYTRFSDLQLAEAQTKKAQMEAAMERVRSRALAMQQPEELMDVAETLRKEMGMLGIAEIETGTIFIFDETNETAEFGFTAKDFSAPEKPSVTDTITIDLNQTWAGKELLKCFRSKEDRSSLRMEGDQRKEWIRYIYSQSAKANNYFGENISDRTYHLLKFSNGAVAAVTDGLTLSDESWELLQRASSVFTLAYSRFKDLTKARIDLINLKEEMKRSDSLLLNILPREIADELKQFGKSYARKHDEVTILFADIKGFSSIAETLSAQELVTQLDECFRAFDHIVDKHGLEKIKTVGDAYVCACGLPKPVVDNATKAVRAAIDMMNFIKGFSITRTIQDLPAFEFRIGIHTGPVVTGVVGLKKFTYDIWGDAVNLAARMEQHGEAGKINISGSTYALIKDKFTCTPRGKIPAKNKGEVEMYFVEHQF